MPASILVIDDDADVRGILAESLKEGGYSVTEASGGRQGLQLLESNSFDLVIIDYAMPGMMGPEVAAAVKELIPDQKLLLVSGYAATSAVETAAESIPLLGKPFKFDDLHATVRELLG